MIEEIRPPSIPPVTEEQLKETDANQKILAARIDPSSRDLLRASAVIKESEGVDLSPKQKERYAEALSQMGRFRDAYEVSGNEKYKRILDAIKNPVCTCPDTEEYRVVDNQRQTIVHSRLFERTKVLVDGKRVPLLMCVKCRNLTIKDA